MRVGSPLDREPERAASTDSGEVRVNAAPCDTPFFQRISLPSVQKGEYLDPPRDSQ